MSQDQCHCVHKESQLKRLAIQDSKARNLLLPCLQCILQAGVGVVRFALSSFLGHTRITVLEMFINCSCNTDVSYKF